MCISGNNALPEVRILAQLYMGYMSILEVVLWGDHENTTAVKTVQLYDKNDAFDNPALELVSS